VSKQPLKDLAQVVRSKNAGPFEITFDMIFSDQPTYERVKMSNVITKETIANLYQIHLEDIVELVYFDQAYAIKFTIKRTISSGAPGERDTYGAQQHAPLLELMIP
jgi:Domain of unknown function (DUF4387)